MFAYGHCGGIKPNNLSLSKYTEPLGTLQFLEFNITIGKLENCSNSYNTCINGFLRTFKTILTFVIPMRVSMSGRFHGERTIFVTRQFFTFYTWLLVYGCYGIS